MSRSLSFRSRFASLSSDLLRTRHRDMFALGATRNFAHFRRYHAAPSHLSHFLARHLGAFTLTQSRTVALTRVAHCRLSNVAQYIIVVGLSQGARQRIHGLLAETSARHCRQGRLFRVYTHM